MSGVRPRVKECPAPSLASSQRYVSSLRHVAPHANPQPRSSSTPSAPKLPLAANAPIPLSPSPTQRTSSSSTPKAPSFNSLNRVVGLPRRAASTFLLSKTIWLRVKRTSSQPATRLLKTLWNMPESWKPLSKPLWPRCSLATCNIDQAWRVTHVSPIAKRLASKGYGLHESTNAHWASPNQAYITIFSSATFCFTLLSKYKTKSVPQVRPVDARKKPAHDPTKTCHCNPMSTTTSRSPNSFTPTQR